ncbi:hypothetical protein JCM30760_20060 [Thiomicrorhabdus hydrogeniphila]
MIPVGLLIMKVVSTIIEKWLPNMTTLKHNLLMGLFMACIMETLLAFSTAVNIFGFSSTEMFYSAWFQGFLASLPLGLVIMLVMTMSVKPRMEKFLKS